MDNMRELLTKIEDTREKLIELLNKKHGQVDSEVVVASQMLDTVLNQYNELLNKKR